MKTRKNPAYIGTHICYFREIIVEFQMTEMSFSLRVSCGAK